MTLPTRNPDYVRATARYWFGGDMICSWKMDDGTGKICDVTFKLEVYGGDLCYVYPSKYINGQLNHTLVPLFVKRAYDNYVADNIILT